MSSQDREDFIECVDNDNSLMWCRLPCPGVVTLCPGAWDSANLELNAGLDSVPVFHSAIVRCQWSNYLFDLWILRSSGRGAGARDIAASASE